MSKLLTMAQGHDEGANKNQHQIPVILKLRQKRLNQAFRRDLLFLIIGALACLIVGYIETHASDIEIRPNIIRSALSKDIQNCMKDRDATCIQDVEDTTHKAKTTGIIDAGFVITVPIHAYLARHRDVNDLLTLLNSALLAIPLLYVIYVTLWKGLSIIFQFSMVPAHENHGDPSTCYRHSLMRYQRRFHSLV